MDHLHELEAVLCLEAAERLALARVPPEVAEVDEGVAAVGAGERQRGYVGRVGRRPAIGVPEECSSPSRVTMK